MGGCGRRPGLGQASERPPEPQLSPRATAARREGRCIPETEAALTNGPPTAARVSEGAVQWKQCEEIQWGPAPQSTPQSPLKASKQNFKGVSNFFKKLKINK